jgi:hypothetical protein
VIRSRTKSVTGCREDRAAVRRRSTAVAASMPSSAIRTPFGLLDQRPVLQTACSCSACRPLTPSTTSSTSLRPASPTPPSTDDPHAGDPGPPAPADPHDQGRLALSMSSTARCGPRSGTCQRLIRRRSVRPPTSSSRWPSRAATGRPASPLSATLSGVRVDQCAGAPADARAGCASTALAASRSALTRAFPTSCSGRQNSPYLRGARRFTGRMFTATTSHALLELPRNSPRTSRDLGLHEHRGSLAAPGVAER